MPLPADLELLRTDDGSPTLAFRRTDGYVERMHHQGGALSESRFIYGHALDEASRLVPGELSVLSVGLGLAYNEILTIEALERTKRRGRIVSHETRAYLRDEFAAWASDTDNGAAKDGLGSVYGEIAGQAGVEAAVVRAWWRDGRVSLRGGFPESVPEGASFDLVYYDAYSNKMDRALWDEDVLVRVFERCLADTCVLATYAATGALNRVLRRLGFEKLERPGFRNKRESTLAVRIARPR